MLVLSQKGKELLELRKDYFNLQSEGTGDNFKRNRCKL